MAKLIVTTTTLDAVIDVGDWFVTDGEHDRASREQFVEVSNVARAKDV